MKLKLTLVLCEVAFWLRFTSKIQRARAAQTCRDLISGVRTGVAWGAMMNGWW